MKRSWFSILLVFTLLGLLALLAALQYQWLGQISDGERERLQKRLQADTGRFADDFNNEIRNTYFTFQLDADTWRKKDWAAFNGRLDYWKNNSAYPALVTDFYFLRQNEAPLIYQPDSKVFEAGVLPDEIAQIAESLKKEDGFEPIVDNIPALVMPIYENLDRIADVPIRRPADQAQKKYGFLVMRLDDQVIKNKLLPDLVNKYFSGDDGANYRLSVVDQKDNSQIIFKNHPEENSSSSDSSARLFSLTPEKMAFFINRDLASSLRRVPGTTEKQSNMIVSQRFESKESVESLPKTEGQRNFNFTIAPAEKPRITVMESHGLDNEGVWLLSVQHRAGSLEQFITNTRNKNLAVSFGILGLLGISVVMIFFSAQRAKKLAQRQMDFVSSVSHEFRTPLAVIYSAGENLTDGVVNSHAQVTEYGTLIKHEGKKLSGMVEQILEFAGARSGRRKYDLRQTEVGQILADALAACRPLIDESGFTVEKNIAEDLPPIIADEKALSHAFQNLINNAIKYSRGDKLLKITAENGGGTIKLSFEDHGLGITAREQSQIFEPFYRGKEVVAAQIHGNGLGLSLVKQIVEAHNGRVKVESRSGEGSKFTVELPC
jgi:signal transduction histidine kinase